MNELEEAIRLEPKNPKFHLLKMKILLEQDKSAEGAKEAFKALEQGAEYIPDVLAMSDEFYLPDAKAVYRKIIEMGNKEVLALSRAWAISRCIPAILPEAEKWFVQARDLQAGTSGGAACLGTADRGESAAFDRRRRRAKSSSRKRERCWRKSKPKAKIRRRSIRNWARSTTSSRCGRRPRSLMSEALRMRRRSNDLRFSLGQSYAQLGRIKEAEQKYREILSLAPDDADALKALQDLGKKY